MDRRLAAGIAITITTAWAASFIASLISQAYEPPASVHALMMIVAGAAFGSMLRGDQS